MKHVIRIIAFAVITIMFTLVMIAFAGQAASKYQPSEVQSLRLKVAQQAAQLAQRDLQDAQTRFQTAVSALRDEGEKVKVESKWPKDVVFDLGSLTFSAPQPAATPAATPTKDAKEKP